MKKPKIICEDPEILERFTRRVRLRGTKNLEETLVTIHAKILEVYDMSDIHTELTIEILPGKTALSEKRQEIYPRSKPVRWSAFFSRKTRTCYFLPGVLLLRS